MRLHLLSSIDTPEVDDRALRDFLRRRKVKLLLNVFLHSSFEQVVKPIDKYQGARVRYLSLETRRFQMALRVQFTPQIDQFAGAGRVNHDLPPL
jgi:hypothetical protein